MFSAMNEIAPKTRRRAAPPAASRLPQAGDELLVRVRVTRTGRNSHDTADTVTVVVPGHDTPVTCTADRLLEAADDR